MPRRGFVDAYTAGRREDAIYKGLAAIYELLVDKNCHPYHPYQVEPVEGE